MTSTLKVNNIQNQCGQNIINENSNTITIGASGDTIALASCASQSGFGRTGTVDWQTGSIKSAATFSATNGEGYFVDTSGNAVTANLPAGSAGAIVSFADYTRTFQTNALTISPNGSEKIGGVAANATLNVEGQSATFVYVDATEGWINVQETSNSVEGRTITNYVIASGGSESTCGDYKIHTFTGPGTFTVTNEGTPSGSNTLDYLVIAGGGGGAQNYSAGGGAGGYRESAGTSSGSYSRSPLGACVAALPATFTSYPIIVGGGGSGYTCGPTSGSPSSFSTITSTGGGRAGGNSSPNPVYFQGLPGGSGGGSRGGLSGGTGNTPPVSPAQGKDGGGSDACTTAGGGGGATAAGTGGTSSSGGNGGAGATSSITGTPTTRAGGGAGKGNAPAGNPGPGGGGAAGSPGGAGGINTGGGGGAASGGCGGTGGSGVVIIRYKFQN